MNARKSKLFIMILSLAICVSALAACAKADSREEKYAKAYELLKGRDYEASYALFVELGDKSQMMYYVMMLRLAA